MMTKRITIIEVKDYVGQEVTIGAWVANKSGKGKIAFLQLRDGTAFFQGVAFKPNFIEKFGEEVGLEKFDTIKRLSQETSVFVTGIVKEDERSKFGYELDITDIEVIGESQDYPNHSKRTRNRLLDGQPPLVVAFTQTSRCHANP